MIFHSKQSKQPVGYILDGIAYITDLFCHKEHFVNVATINVSESELTTKIQENS
jgi:hypothetical protein